VRLTIPEAAKLQQTIITDLQSLAQRRNDNEIEPEDARRQADALIADYLRRCVEVAPLANAFEAAVGIA
jgi:hypothetical protein